MSKTIIAVRGQPNSGKTTTLKLAYKTLAKVGRNIYSNPRSNAKELKEVIDIDGVIIGFVSSGDMPARLEKMLHFLLHHGCAVIVCAARLDRHGKPIHPTIEAVEKFSEENGFELEWIDKVRNERQWEIANSKVATQIVATVRTAINEFNSAASVQ